MRLQSDPGDWVGGGREFFFSPEDGTFTASDGLSNGASIVFDPGVSGSRWFVSFVPPSGQSLAPGVYEGAMRSGFQPPSVPGLDVAGQGRGCNALLGSFEVLEIVHDPDGGIASFRATFEQHCEYMLPALRGEVRFNAHVFTDLTVPGRVSGRVGEALGFEVAGVAVEGGPIVLEAARLPEGATFADRGDGTGRFEWTPSPDQVGSHTLEFSGKDSLGRGESASAIVLVGDTFHVPADYQNIQSAIEAVPPGSRVIVAPGIYQENLDFLGKPLTLESESGPEATILDGGGAAPAIVFRSVEGRDSVVRGFTIRNGFSDFTLPWFGTGGGIYVGRAAPSILDNLIIHNRGCLGTGIGVDFGDPLIQGNVITDNRLGPCSSREGAIGLRGEGDAEILENLIVGNHGDGGGGIYLSSAGRTRIVNNVIRGNTASFGGGISMIGYSDFEIAGNLIVDNEAGEGGGIWLVVARGTRGPRLVNNTIVRNSGIVGSAIYSGGTAPGVELVNNVIIGKEGQTALYCHRFSDFDLPPNLRFNDVYAPGGERFADLCTDRTGIDGNISVDPSFACAVLDDFRPAPGSPVIDAGDGAVPDLPGFDVLGGTRVLDGDQDGASDVDLGAYEFDPSAEINRCLYLYCPEDVRSYAPRGLTSGPVDYPPPVGPPGATISCVPPSGTVFEAGTTTVTCTATIPDGASELCSFRVTVLVPPLNDDVEYAATVPALPFRDHLDTRSATADADDPFCTGPKVSVWYAYTPAEDLVLTADTEGSSYNAIVSAFTETVFGELSYVTCNYRRIDFQAYRGRTVYLQIGSESDGGDLEFSLTGRAPLKVEIDIDRRGLLLPNGDALLSGTVICSRPTTVAVSGEARVTDRGASVVRTFSLTPVCEGSTPWQATIAGTGGNPRIGRAIVQVTATADSSPPPESSVSYHTGSVSLRQPRGKNPRP